MENAFSDTVSGHAANLGAAVSSAGLRAVAGRPELVQPAKTAFVGGLDDVLLTGAVVLVVGAVAALALMRTPAPAAAPAPGPAPDTNV